jgi:hypothetical protein
MPPKKLATFRFGAVDRRRLQKLAEKRECSQAAALRYAIKVAAAMEGIK